MDRALEFVLTAFVGIARFAANYCPAVEGDRGNSDCACESLSFRRLTPMLLLTLLKSDEAIEP